MPNYNTSKSLAKAKYEIIEIDNIEVQVDLSMFQKSEELFFNATAIAKQCGKKPSDFWKNSQNREYLNALASLVEGSESDFVITKNGGRHSGTWFHNDLALQFARWLSPMFAVKLDIWIRSKIDEEHERKQKRLELKTGYLPLTDAIQHAHEDPKFYHYSNEADLINRIVTGMSAKEFKRVHGVENVRDGLTAAESKLMDRLQRQNASLIELGFSFEERKRLLAAQASKAA
jgi:hypothetical protein